MLLLFLAGGADLARAYFVGVQTSDAARESALFIARNASYDSLTDYQNIEIQGSSTGSCSGTDCSTCIAADKCPAVTVGAQAFAGSLLSCPSGSTTFNFTPYAKRDSPLSQTFPSGGDVADAGYTTDSFSVKVTVTCALPLLTPILLSPVSVVATSSAYVVEP